MRRPTLWLSLLAALPCAAGDKIATDLEQKLKQNQAGEMSIIVQFAGDSSDQDVQDVQRKGGKLNARLGPVAAFSIPAGQVRDVAAHPHVTYVSPDRGVRGQLTYSTAAVHADIAWKYGWSGTGIGIAIVDSGISPARDLAQSGKGSSRVIYSEAFGGLANSLDFYGHGTHVAGIAAGDGTESQGLYQGIAPKANLINLRVLDENGAGTESAVIAAIARAIELKARYNIRVLNLSLGRPVYESYLQDPLCRAAEAAWKAGIVVVAAAGNGGRDNTFGNRGYATILAPANDPYVIAVGAMKAMDTLSKGDDLIASYSAKGPTVIDHIVKPDLVAPGNSVASTLGNGSHMLARLYPQNSVNGGYFRLSGTSMAAPVVAGAAALLLEQDPALTPAQVKARLMKTASRNFPSVSYWSDPSTGVTYASGYDPFTVGAGYLDIHAALNDHQPVSKTALSPAAVFHPETGQVSIVYDASVVWGSSIVWGSSVVWADAMTKASSVVWADSDSVVWADCDSVVWADSLAAAAGRVPIFGER